MTKNARQVLDPNNRRTEQKFWEGWKRRFHGMVYADKDLSPKPTQKKGRK